VRRAGERLFTSSSLADAKCAGCLYTLPGRGETARDEWPFFTVRYSLAGACFFQGRSAALWELAGSVKMAKWISGKQKEGGSNG
jgi:hypothetical protein